LADALTQMAERLRPCSRCFSFAEDELCPICEDRRRDPTLLCVVEEPSAILPIERTHEYRGYYHVLGGALSPIDGVDPEDLRIDELVQRVHDEGIQELVVATNPTMTGEATALYLADVLRGKVQLTRLASGLPVGADLEHADELTLGRALLGRRVLE
jgi:recombination protein RecR